MKKNSLKKLAFLGISAGVCVVQGLNAKETPNTSEKKTAVAADDPNDGNLGYHMMTEEELLVELNDEGVKQYQSLSPEGKEIAREIASARCNGTNHCKGRNACKTDENDCAGKGSCKGKGKCAVSDKNLAVKLAADVMANKRAEVLKK